MDPRRRLKSGPFPGKTYFAKPNPPREQKKRVRSVEAVDVKMELMKYCRKGSSVKSRV